jgi:putative transposase
LIFDFIAAHQPEWPVTVMCDLVDVSTAGYYAWRTRPVSAGQQRRDRLIAEIRVIHETVTARYGSPRIHAE